MIRNAFMPTVLACIHPLWIRDDGYGRLPGVDRLSVLVRARSVPYLALEGSSERKQFLGQLVS